MKLKKLVRKRVGFLVPMLLIFITCLTWYSSSFAVSSNSVLPSEFKNLTTLPSITPPDDNKLGDIKVVGDLKYDPSQVFIANAQTNMSKNAKGVRNGTVLVLVNGDVYPDIKTSIGTYTSDLASEGYTTKVYTVRGKDPIQLKSFLRDRWYEIYGEYSKGKVSLNAFLYGTGSFLIGDLPVPLVHSRGGEYTDDNGVKKPYEGTFVCDLYLTDMDGNWDYTDENGIPFISTVDPSIIKADSECTIEDFSGSKWKPFYNGGKGGAKPEIWMGRLASTPLANVNNTTKKSNESVIINDYFKRNHAYRHGNYPFVPPKEKGEKYAARDRMLYIDDPWADSAPKIIDSYKQTWPGPIAHDNQTSSVPVNRYVNTDYVTGHKDYLSRISNRNLWVEFLAHSNPWNHEFVQWKYNNTTKEWEWQDEGWLGVGDLDTAPMNALFYNIQGCDACDYRQDHYLGGMYLFKGQSLAVIGNTTVGPHDSGTLLQALANGSSLGLAYMLNQQAFGTNYWVTNMVSGYDDFDAKRCYGQTLLGDPTLKPIVFIPKALPYSIGHEKTDYKKISNVLKNMTVKKNVKLMAESVKKKAISESRNKIKIIAKTPEKGYEYLKLDVNKLIVDPQFKIYVDQNRFMQRFTYGLTLEETQTLIFAGSPVSFSGILSMKANTASTSRTIPTPLQGKEVGLYEVFKRGGKIISTTFLGTGLTDSNGKYLIEVKPTEGSHTYKATFKNAAGKEVAASAEKTITATKLVRISR